jgi:hypothetical protein
MTFKRAARPAGLEPATDPFLQGDDVHLDLSSHPSLPWVSDAEATFEDDRFSMPHQSGRGSDLGRFLHNLDREAVVEMKDPELLRRFDSVRRECLDHVIVFHETGLRRILKNYFEYYQSSRTHLSLEKDAPVSRPVEPPRLAT